MLFAAPAAQYDRNVIDDVAVTIGVGFSLNVVWLSLAGRLTRLAFELPPNVIESDFHRALTSYPLPKGLPTYRFGRRVSRIKKTPRCGGEALRHEDEPGAGFVRHFAERHGAGQNPYKRSDAIDLHLIVAESEVEQVAKAGPKIGLDIAHETP